MLVLSFIILLAGIAVASFLLHEKYRANKSKEIQVGSNENEDITERYLNNYNYLRGKELFDAEDYKQAFEYLNKAIEDDINNGYAHGLIARIFQLHEDYGMALRAHDKAIECMSEEKSSFLYLSRAETYRLMGKNAEWLADCSKAIEVDPNSATCYEARADYFYQQGMHEEAIADIDEFIKLDPHNPYGYMVKGRSLMVMEKAEDALDLFKSAESLNPNYIAAYSFQVEPLLALNRKKEAVDAEIKALELSLADEQVDNKAVRMQEVLATEVGEIFFLRLKAKIAEGFQSEKWMSHLAAVLSLAGHYSEAACWYEKAYQLSEDVQILYFSAFCWRMAGNLKKAEMLVQKVLEKKPDYTECRRVLAGAIMDQGRVSEAVEVLNTLIVKNPDEPLWYYHRALLYEILGHKDAALKDYRIAVSLNGNQLDSSYRFGKLKAELDSSGSNEELQNIVETCDLSDRDFFVVNALLLLGKRDEAKVCADHLLELLPEYGSKEDKERISIELVEAYYKMGNVDKALSCAETLLSLGYNRFWYLLNNPDLGDFCKNEMLVCLVEKYRLKAEKEWEECSKAILLDSEETNTEGETITLKATSISFTRENGICKVPCSVNSLPLHFVFDTGASDVSISSVEANFMLKNGYLSQSDLGGKEYFSTASGEISEGTKIRLNEVNFGGLKLKNIKASVVKNQTAPLLLGQSVLQRLGTIEIDNVNNVLKVTS